MTEPGIIIASILIGLIGIPHGALDPIVAKRLGVWENLSGLILFLTGYVFMTVIVVLVWLNFPMICLFGFLAVSLVHFGRDLAYESISLGYAYGAFVLGIPAFFQPIEVTRILSFVSLSESATIAVFCLKCCFILSIIFFIWMRKSIPLRVFGELLFLLLVVVTVNPIWYFVVFFCGLHSPRHFWEEIQHLSSEATFGVFICVLVLTIITLLTGLAVFFYFEGSGSLEERIIQILFIGLAALTIPHMILIEYRRYSEIQRKF